MKFVKNIQKFNKFLKKINMEERNIYKVNKNIDTGHILHEKKILLTGFRDDDILNKIRNVGANISTSVSKNLDILIIKDKNVQSSKLDKAKTFDTIDIVTKSQFITKYFQ